MHDAELWSSYEAFSVAVAAEVDKRIVSASLHPQAAAPGQHPRQRGTAADDALAVQEREQQEQPAGDAAGGGAWPAAAGPQGHPEELQRMLEQLTAGMQGLASPASSLPSSKGATSQSATSGCAGLQSVLQQHGLAPAAADGASALLQAVLDRMDDIVLRTGIPAAHLVGSPAGAPRADVCPVEGVSGPAGRSQAARLCSQADELLDSSAAELRQVQHELEVVQRLEVAAERIGDAAIQAALAGAKAAAQAATARTAARSAEARAAAAVALPELAAAVEGTHDGFGWQFAVPAAQPLVAAGQAQPAAAPPAQRAPPRVGVCQHKVSLSVASDEILADPADSNGSSTCAGLSEEDEAAPGAEQQQQQGTARGPEAAVLQQPGEADAQQQRHGDEQQAEQRMLDDLAALSIQQYQQYTQEPLREEAVASTWDAATAAWGPVETVPGADVHDSKPWPAQEVSVGVAVPRQLWQPAAQLAAAGTAVQPPLLATSPPAPSVGTAASSERISSAPLTASSDFGSTPLTASSAWSEDSEATSLGVAGRHKARALRYRLLRRQLAAAAGLQATPLGTEAGSPALSLISSASDGLTSSSSGGGSPIADASPPTTATPPSTAGASTCSTLSTLQEVDSRPWGAQLGPLLAAADPAAAPSTATRTAGAVGGGRGLEALRVLKDRMAAGRRTPGVRS
ncbi:hypothetical protein C2E20_8886 [Micractinium conductrix]|uniref:Uncharacterized protein n=1 Tax=Micractinium conductrix TaxID=554055 RepID=A0A2P6V067_9CHLO|nr:hypothetical protein C2E20_8886 [Micractinium conductrix]|eukprot:PSC67434.1 hypothetical protein C2E20_8886 [Micractinium conductrix]